MTDQTSIVETLLLRGPAGAVEGLQESPADREPRGVAVLCHPHPLHGGTLDNKVIYTLARSFLQLGCVAVRFNFRGVGGSEGSFSDGIGEAEDTEVVAEWARLQWPDLNIYLGGFSFGAMVAVTVTAKIDPDGLVTVAPPVERLSSGISQPQCPWLVLQGDEDEVVDADAVVNWLNELEPGPELRVMRGAEHFFHGRLMELRENVIEFFQPQISVDP